MSVNTYHSGALESLSSHVELVGVQKVHWKCYRKLYQCREVMKYIGKPLSDQVVNKSFALLFERASLNPDCVTKIIKFRAQEIGLIQTKLKGNYWYLGIMLLPEYHGQGIAYKSHELIINLIEQSSCYSKHHSLVAECMSENSAANALYRSLGFKLMSSKTEKNTTTNRWER